MNLDNSTMSGPSRDYHTLYGKEQVWRDEPHAIDPGRAQGYSFALKPRPDTQKKPHYDLVPGRVPVLVRNSNINPAADGSGAATSEWSVSNQMLGQEDPGFTPPTKALNTKTVVAGLVLGFLVFRLAAG